MPTKTAVNLWSLITDRTHSDCRDYEIFDELVSNLSDTGSGYQELTLQAVSEPGRVGWEIRVFSVSGSCDNDIATIFIPKDRRRITVEIPGRHKLTKWFLD